MGTMYWIRVGMLVLTLALVIAVMRNLQSGHSILNPIGQAVLGGGGSAAPSATKIVICPTRVRWLETADGTRLEEKDLKWERVTGAGRVELDPIAVEKWFAAHCTMPAKMVTDNPDPASTYAPALRLGFVSGEPETLEIVGAPGDKGTVVHYRWQGQRYTSPAMDEALHELSTLPVRKAPGS